MATFKRLRGSYWEAYPVPECEARCMARRTLAAAFGGSPTLSVPVPRRRWPWLYMLGYGVGCALLLMALVAAHAHGVS